MISLAHIKGKQQPAAHATVSSSATAVPSDKEEGDAMYHKTQHKRQQDDDEVVGKKSESRAIRPNSQFLSRLVGQNENTNRKVSVASLAASHISSGGKDQHAPDAEPNC